MQAVRKSGTRIGQGIVFKRSFFDAIWLPRLKRLSGFCHSEFAQGFRFSIGKQQIPRCARNDNPRQIGRAFFRMPLKPRPDTSLLSPDLFQRVSYVIKPVSQT